MLPVAGGECFCVWRCPAESSALRGAVLHLPAFGDEMNKSRAMIASASRRFAMQGFGVLTLDPLGTGDSTGDFVDGSIGRWAEDIGCALDWLDTHTAGPLWLWCLRFGALLAPPVLKRTQTKASLLLWQPVIAGAQYLTHLLRMKIAGAPPDATGDRQDLARLRQRIREGHSIEIGGYGISSRLACELEKAGLDVPRESVGPIRWLEVSSSAAPMLSPAARARIGEFDAAGIDVTGTVVQGPGFWQSAEIESCPGLIDASVTALVSESILGIPRDSAVL
jgi:exosortase A-associated hydrolase 2